MFFNRDISWIQFNSRVLHQALDVRTPLLERVKFIQIFTTNLDEFFMKRVGGLKRQVALGINAEMNGKFSPNELLSDIRTKLLPLLEIRTSCWSDQILPELNQQGIHILKWNDLYPEEQTFIHTFFDKNLFPVLTPLSVGPGHPFPFLSNLSYSLGVLLVDPRSPLESESMYQTEPLFARLKLPNTFQQWIRLPSFSSTLGKVRFISVKDIVTHHLGRLFPGMNVLDVFSFRITRNADIERDEEDAEDLLEMITEELRQRRLAEIVRLEHGPFSSSLLRDFLKTELELADDEIYQNSVEIDFSEMSALLELKRRDLKFPVWNPVVPEAFRESDSSIFSAIRESDVLVHHPYESFTHSVEKFIRTAVDDPKVLAIKMTLYRTGAGSPFIPLLIRAAESGKQVVCLVELKARFDEERNIKLARSLEYAGVHVVYGIVGLKTHCKVALVVRQEEGHVRSYAHIGTGNYHAVTSSIYTDFGLFTARPEVTEDVVHLFHFLTGRSLNREYKRLLIAPVQMKQKFLEFIRNESENARMKRPARIIAKMNSLEDTDIIRELYSASQAGVEIDLIVRGFCCLVPQRSGLSERIRVISIIGRFLEHCRVFFFQNGSMSPVDGMYLLGSADWMSRNLTRRVEAIAPVDDPILRNRLYEFLQVVLSDQRLAWDLGSDGVYRQRHSPDGTGGTHDIEMKFYDSIRHWPISALSASH